MAVRDVRFFTAFDRPEKVLEGPFEVNRADQAYTKLPDQVMAMQAAGVALDVYRRNRFHVGPGEEIAEDFVDLTIQPGFDPADAQTLAENIASRTAESISKAEKEQQKEQPSIDGLEAKKEENV